MELSESIKQRYRVTMLVDRRDIKRNKECVRWNPNLEHGIKLKT